MANIGPEAATWANMGKNVGVFRGVPEPVYRGGDVAFDNRSI